MSDIYIDPTGKMPGSFRTLAEWEKWKDEKRSDPMSKHTREELIKHLRRSVSGMERAAADMLESDGELIAAWERAGLTPPRVVEGYRAALERITTTRFSGSCCGCSGDDGFDAVQEIAVAALAAGKGEG